MPGQHSIERYLIEEQLKHILQAHQIERKEWYVNTIIHILFVPEIVTLKLKICSFSIVLSKKYKPSFSAAQLLSYPLKTKIPLEYMIVEVMFGELFRLPNPEFLEICYGSILIELCKLQPSTMPQVLAQATELLYERIDNMNVTCFDR